MMIYMMDTQKHRVWRNNFQKIDCFIDVSTKEDNKRLKFQKNLHAT